MICCPNFNVTVLPKLHYTYLIKVISIAYYYKCAGTAVARPITQTAQEINNKKSHKKEQENIKK
jgi:hypothetical protein